MGELWTAPADGDGGDADASSSRRVQYYTLDSERCEGVGAGVAATAAAYRDAPWRDLQARCNASVWFKTLATATAVYQLDRRLAAAWQNVEAAHGLPGLRAPGALLPGLPSPVQCPSDLDGVRSAPGVAAILRALHTAAGTTTAATPANLVFECLRWAWYGWRAPALPPTSSPAEFAAAWRADMQAHVEARTVASVAWLTSLVEGLQAHADAVEAAALAARRSSVPSLPFPSPPSPRSGSGSSRGRRSGAAAAAAAAGAVAAARGRAAAAAALGALVGPPPAE